MVVKTNNFKNIEVFFLNRFEYVIGFGYFLMERT